MLKKIFLCLTAFLLSTVLFAQTEKDLEQAAPLALKNGEFVLYFQPICKFGKNKICGAEVLTRWQKNNTLIPPYKFIPLFEENGFITELDKYVFENTLKYIKNWQDNGLKIGFISLNLSAIDLNFPEIATHFKNLIENYKIDPQYLVIEITETSEIKNKENAKKFITLLKETGFKIALDDFGDGYATLENLNNYPYDIVKLSKKLLKNFKEKPTKEELKKTIKIIKNKPVIIIAEGIENKKEAKFLKNLGVHLAQGYLFYKPMPAKEFEKLLPVKTNKSCNL